MNGYLLDTSSLLLDPDIVFKLQGKRYIPVCILEELDGLKNENYNARQVIRNLQKADVEYILDDCVDIDLPPDFDKTKNDNKILWLAWKNGFILVTDDLALQQKAKSLGVAYKQVETQNENYTGYKEFIITDSSEDQERLACLYEDLSNNLFDLLVNQYLIIKDESGEVKDILRWDGNKHVNLKLPPKNVIKPLNPEQSCALDLLHNKYIPIKILCGNFGSGKTYLATRLGFYYTLDKGLYNKVLVCRNPLGSGEKIGALPGDKYEKISEFFIPIKQNAEAPYIESLIESGQLEFNIPFYIKGTTYDNTWMIIDEAEDLDIKTFRLIGSRIGQNSCIVFCGDYKQAESKFERNNGLKYAVEKLKGNPLVGIVFLKEDVRSDASKVFLELR